MKTIAITYSNGTGINLGIEVPDDALVTIINDGQPIEASSSHSQYRIRHNVKRGEGWNSDMDSLKGRVLTEEEYDRVINERGVVLPWSKGYYILPGHLELMTESKAAEVKKYRIKTKEELLADGWVEMPGSSGNVLENPDPAGMNILEQEYSALGRLLTEEENVRVSTANKATVVDDFWIPLNALTKNLEIPKVKPKECSEDHYIADFEIFRYMPGFEVDGDGDIENCETNQVYTKEMKYLGGTKLTPEQIEEIIMEGVIRVPYADGEGTWAVYRWMTTLAEYTRPLKVKTWDDVKDDPSMIVKEDIDGETTAQHCDRRTGYVVYNSTNAWVGNKELTGDEYRTLLKSDKVSVRSTDGRRSLIVPWKLKLA